MHFHVNNNLAYLTCNNLLHTIKEDIMPAKIVCLACRYSQVCNLIALGRILQLLEIKLIVHFFKNSMISVD